MKSFLEEEQPELEVEEDLSEDEEDDDDHLMMPPPKPVVKTVAQEPTKKPEISSPKKIRERYYQDSHNLNLKN